MGFVYLDYNATTPIDPQVADEMRPYLDGFFGNPSSPHLYGRQAKAAVEEARARAARCLGADDDEIIFTSGGTEANNLAICGVALSQPGCHIITSRIEHPAVLEVVSALGESGSARVTIVGVDQKGRVDPEAVAAAIEKDTALVSIMLANNEVGTIQPIQKIAQLCHSEDPAIVVHTDAAQAMGKIPVRVEELGVDLLSVAGHKLYAPKGVGLLYQRSGVALRPFLRGAGHEKGRRPGTENVLQLVGLGKACAMAQESVAEAGETLRQRRDLLADLLRISFPQLLVHGDPGQGLPNTLSVALPGVEATALLAELQDRVAASAGAACHGANATASHVLEAMGVSLETARSTIRLSVGKPTTEEELRRGAKEIAAAAARLS